MLSAPVDIGFWEWVSGLDPAALVILAGLALGAFVVLAVVIGRLAVVFALLAGLGLVLVTPGGVLMIGGGLLLGVVYLLTRAGVGGSVSIENSGDNCSFDVRMR